MNQRQALVIGASSGIGASTALGLADLDWAVTAVARREDRLRDIELRNPKIRTTTLDVTDASALNHALEQVGPLDALIYAAGWNFPNRELDVLDPEDWLHAFSVNVNGAFIATRAALPQMRLNGGGVIVYVSSISAVRADASGAAYQASKRALHGLAEAINLEEVGHGIRASIVMPGLTKTEFNSLRRTPPSETQRAGFLTSQNVADAIIFICQLPASVMIPELTIVPTANPWNR
jgi:NADP-dependent 3-hydroxy acid dehydrogenase YdfG